MIDAGAMLRAARERRGLSQRKAASLTYRHNYSFGQIEQGKVCVSLALFAELMESMGYEIEIVVREAGKRVSI